MFDISGKVAVVTGGGRGIGLMIASAFVSVRRRPFRLVAARTLPKIYAINLVICVVLGRAAPRCTSLLATLRRVRKLRRR